MTRGQKVILLHGNHLLMSILLSRLSSTNPVFSMVKILEGNKDDEKTVVMSFIQHLFMLSIGHHRDNLMDNHTSI